MLKMRAPEFLAGIIPPALRSEITLVAAKGPFSNQSRSTSPEHLHPTRYAFVDDLSHVTLGNRMNAGR